MDLWGTVKHDPSKDNLVVTGTKVTKVSCSPTGTEKVLGNHLVLKFLVILVGEVGLEKIVLPENHSANISKLYYK